jgi:hypothetical protein
VIIDHLPWTNNTCRTMEQEGFWIACPFSLTI